MKTFYSFFLIIILIFVSCNDESSVSLEKINNDSLKFYFDKANDENLDYKNRYSAADSIKKIISLQNNDSLNRKNYFKLANRYFNMNAMDDYRTTTEFIIKKSLEAKDSISLAKAYSYLGDYYGTKFESEQAYKNYYNAEKIYLKLKDDAKVAKTFLNKSVLQFNEKDFIGSEKSAIEALKILKETNNNDLNYEANNVLGVIYHELSEFDKAIQHHNAALLILKKMNIPLEFQSRATSLNNIGAVYQKKKDYIKALSFYNESLKSTNLLENKPVLYTASLGNIAYCKFKLNKFETLPNDFYKALKINDSIKYSPGVINNKLNLSEFYDHQKNISLSQKFAKEAYKLAKEKKLSNEELFALKQLSKVDPQNSSIYSANYIRINDSLQLAERKIRNKLARIEFETDELIVQKDKLVEQRESLIYFGFALFVVGIFVYVIRIQASKNRELLLIQQQQAANEEIYQLMLTQQEKAEAVRQLEKKKIGQELHDSVLGKMFGTRMSLGVLNTSSISEDVEKRSTFIEHLKDIEQEIREISHDLNSEKTAIQNNFVLMLMNFIENQKEVYSTMVLFTLDNKIDWNEIDNLVKINLYRILQESFQNINKYAQASQIEVIFQQKEETIELKIQDNGKGFDVHKKKKGIGLQNIQSRVKNLNGVLQINSKIGAGTTLTIIIPKYNLK